MRNYALQRVLLIIPTLVLAGTIIFAILRILPGDAVVLMLGSEGQVYTKENEEALRQRLGMDKPVVVQYVQFWGDLMRGDLGTSIWTKRPVIEDILSRLPVTIELLGIAIVVGWVWGILVGIIAAVKPDSLTDHVARSAAILGLSVPIFWTGELLIVLPARYFQWTPLRPFQYLWDSPLENLQLMIFPALVLAIFLGAPVMRLTRTTLLDVLRQDYIRTAKAKGLSSRSVIWRHSLRNALLPVVTLMGIQVVLGLGGVVILESLFSIPGMGQLLVSNALPKRDYPMIQGINIIIASAAAVVSLLVDLSYGFLDPRVQH